jgi:hypothetical protein
LGHQGIAALDLLDEVEIDVGGDAVLGVRGGGDNDPSGIDDGASPDEGEARLRFDSVLNRGDHEGLVLGRPPGV